MQASAADQKTIEYAVVVEIGVGILSGRQINDSWMASGPVHDDRKPKAFRFAAARSARCWSAAIPAASKPERQGRRRPSDRCLHMCRSPVLATPGLGEFVSLAADIAPQ